MKKIILALTILLITLPTYAAYSGGFRGGSSFRSSYSAPRTVSRTTYVNNGSSGGGMLTGLVLGNMMANSGNNNARPVAVDNSNLQLGIATCETISNADQKRNCLLSLQQQQTNVQSTSSDDNDIAIWFLVGLGVLLIFLFGLLLGAA